MSQDDSRDDLRRSVDRLSPEAVAALLEFMERLCDCGGQIIIRDSKRIGIDGSWVERRVCKRCGAVRPKIVRRT